MHTGIQAYLPTNIHAYIHTNIQSGIPTNIQTHRHTYIQASGPACGQAGGNTYIHTPRQHRTIKQAYILSGIYPKRDTVKHNQAGSKTESQACIHPGWHTGILAGRQAYRQAD